MITQIDDNMWVFEGLFGLTYISSKRIGIKDQAYDTAISMIDECEISVEPCRESDKYVNVVLTIPPLNIKRTCTVVTVYPDALKRTLLDDLKYAKEA